MHISRENVSSGVDPTHTDKHTYTQYTHTLLAHIEEDRGDQHVVAVVRSTPVAFEIHQKIDELPSLSAPSAAGFNYMEYTISYCQL